MLNSGCTLTSFQEEQAQRAAWFTFPCGTCYKMLLSVWQASPKVLQSLLHMSPNILQTSCWISHKLQPSGNVGPNWLLSLWLNSPNVLQSPWHKDPNMLLTLWNMGSNRLRFLWQLDPSCYFHCYTGYPHIAISVFHWRALQDADFNNTFHLTHISIPHFQCTDPTVHSFLAHTPVCRLIGTFLLVQWYNHNCIFYLMVHSCGTLSTHSLGVRPSSCLLSSAVPLSLYTGSSSGGLGVGSVHLPGADHSGTLVLWCLFGPTHWVSTFYFFI